MMFEVKLTFDEVVEAIRMYLEHKEPGLMQSYYVSDVLQENDEENMCSVEFLEVDLQPIPGESEGGEE